MTLGFPFTLSILYSMGVPTGPAREARLMERAFPGPKRWRGPLNRISKKEGMMPIETKISTREWV